MKGTIIGILWAIGIIGFIFTFVVIINRDTASDGNTMVSEFQYENDSYFIYLDDDLSFNGELDITIRKGLHRAYVMTFDVEPDGTTNDIIQHFKEELTKEIAEERHNDSLVEAWQAKQKTVIQRLKANN